MLRSCQGGPVQSQQFWRVSDDASVPCGGLQHEDPWSASKLAHLSKLENFQALSLVAHDMAAESGFGSLWQFAAHRGRSARPRWAFLASLAALTALDIALTRRDEVCALSSLTNLHELVVKATSGETTQLPDAAWTAVGQLTGLTELQLWNAQVAASPVFADAVSKLPRLEVFAAKLWHPAVLPELKTLPRLTDIYGGWEAGDTQDTTLLQVRTLDAAEGAVPFTAFPGLVELGQRGSVAVECLGIVAESCLGLRDWWHADIDNVSIQSNRAHKYVPAIKPLSQLTQLTRLEFTPDGDFEFVAFATAAQHLVRAGSLRVVRVDADSSWEYFSLAALMHLGRLSGLRELAVCLGRAAGTLHDSYDAATFISGLCGFGRVLFTACDEQLAVLKSAQAVLAGLQVEVPEVELRQWQD